MYDLCLSLLDVTIKTTATHIHMCRYTAFHIRRYTAIHVCRHSIASLIAVAESMYVLSLLTLMIWHTGCVCRKNMLTRLQLRAMFTSYDVVAAITLLPP